MKWIKPNGMIIELQDRPSTIAVAEKWGLKRVRGRPPGSKNKVKEDIPVSVPGPQTESVSALEINIPSP